MRPFLFCFFHILITTLFLVSAMFFNYFIDGFAIFNNKMIEKISTHIINGNSIANLLNLDERTIHEMIIKNHNKAYDVIALGSSRIMPVSQDFFQMSFFNHGMSGAVLNDYLGILGLYIKNNKMPKAIIFGLDPWILNSNPDSRWKSLYAYVNFFKEHSLNKSTVQISLEQNNFLSKARELLSLSYTIYNFKLLTSKEKIYFLNNRCDPRFSCFLQDGSHKESQEESLATIEETRAKARQYSSSHPIYHLENFNHLDTEDFEKMIDFLQRKKIKVIFYLPPYHPLVYEKISNDKRYKNAIEAEKYFVDFAKKHHIRIIGSYNPNKVDIKELDFYDGMHLKRESYKKIFETPTIQNM